MAEFRYAARAAASLSTQDNYLRPRNPSAADAVLAEIDRTATLIADFPNIGRAIEGTSLRYHVTRKYRYRMIYRLRSDTVEIVDVLHPRQGPG